MSKNGKMTIEKLASMVARGFGRVEERVATKDDLAATERRLSAQIEAIP